MHTPKTLSSLQSILETEELGTLPGLGETMKSLLAGEPITLDACLKISRNGKLEAYQPRGPLAYPNRIKTRKLVRVVTRAAKIGFPIGEATKTWLAQVLRADDMAREAKDALMEIRS